MTQGPASEGSVQQACYEYANQHGIDGCLDIYIPRRVEDRFEWERPDPVGEYSHLHGDQDLYGRLLQNESP